MWPFFTSINRGVHIMPFRGFSVPTGCGMRIQPMMILLPSLSIVLCGASKSNPFQRLRKVGKFSLLYPQVNQLLSAKIRKCCIPTLIYFGCCNQSFVSLNPPIIDNKIQKICFPLNTDTTWFFNQFCNIIHLISFTIYNLIKCALLLPFNPFNVLAALFHRIESYQHNPNIGTGFRYHQHPYSWYDICKQYHWNITGKAQHHSEK